MNMLCNMNVRSKALNVCSKALNGHSKALNEILAAEARKYNK